MTKGKHVCGKAIMKGIKKCYIKTKVANHNQSTKIERAMHIHRMAVMQRGVEVLEALKSMEAAPADDSDTVSEGVKSVSKTEAMDVKREEDMKTEKMSVEREDDMPWSEHRIKDFSWTKHVWRGQWMFTNGASPSSGHDGLLQLQCGQL